MLKKRSGGLLGNKRKHSGGLLGNKRKQNIREDYTKQRKQNIREDYAFKEWLTCGDDGQYTLAIRCVPLVWRLVEGALDLYELGGVLEGVVPIRVLRDPEPPDLAAVAVADAAVDAGALLDFAEDMLQDHQQRIAEERRKHRQDTNAEYNLT